MPATVYPTGTTLCDPQRCCNGYTVILLPGEDGVDVALIDMNGRPEERPVSAP